MAVFGLKTAKKYTKIRVLAIFPTNYPTIQAVIQKDNILITVIIKRSKFIF
jgi:hypothetical protein